MDSIHGYPRDSPAGNAVAAASLRCAQGRHSPSKEGFGAAMGLALSGVKRHRRYNDERGSGDVRSSGPRLSVFHRKRSAQLQTAAISYGTRSMPRAFVCHIE
jgi:hypothetical protein